MPPPKYKIDEIVSYKPVDGSKTFRSVSMGMIHGIVTNHEMQASDSTPKYQIESFNTGKMKAIKEGNILAH
ncbi:MAG: hypothetical protein M1827_005546 [Pycnora praestabilis]|nr:MAG: hypothetical protein M1827_005546 [Pycnora praestabilis]